MRPLRREGYTRKVRVYIQHLMVSPRAIDIILRGGDILPTRQEYFWLFSLASSSVKIRKNHEYNHLCATSPILLYVLPSVLP